MGSNADVEQNIVANPVLADDGNGNEKLESPPNDQVEEKEPEPSFDEGVLPWIQVFGSFFCFFNSW